MGVLDNTPIDKLIALTRMKGIAEESMGFSVGEAKATIPTKLHNPSKKNLQDTPTAILGGVDLRPQNMRKNPGILRFMPLGHPVARSLVATSISGVRGAGKYTMEPPRNDPFLGNVPGFPLWEDYEIGIDYSAPLYPIRPDSFIKRLTGYYYNRLGTRVKYYYANEWHRFTRWMETPDHEILGNKNAQMFFETSDNAPPGAPPNKTHTQFAGTPFQALPNSTVKVKWYQVPYSFVDSDYSYLANCPIGVINQNPISLPRPDGTSKTYQAGTLLWGGFSYTDYYPSIPADGGQLFGLNLGFNESKLVDIEMTFKRTTRDKFALRVPSRARVGADANGNWILGGWNLQPVSNIPFVYSYAHYVDSLNADTRLDKTKWFPTHFSFPFELFFSNPDYDQPDRANMIEVKP